MMSTLFLTRILWVAPNRQCRSRRELGEKESAAAACVAARIRRSVIGPDPAAEQRRFPRQVEVSGRVVIADAVGNGATIGLVRVVGELRRLIEKIELHGQL